MCGFSRGRGTELMTAAKSGSGAAPLCVALNGSLIHTDLAHESLFAALSARPWLILLIPVWLLVGPSAFKARIAALTKLDVAHLPYDERVLAHLAEEKAKGRRLVLVADAPSDGTDAVAAHLGLFDEVVTARGAARTAELKQVYARYAYLGGGARGDIGAWAGAETVGVANAPPGLRRRLAGRPVEVDIPPRGGLARAAVRAIRPYQWAKNLLVFVPILTSNNLSNLSAWMMALLAFAGFSATASGIYILNDLMDLAADRRHPRKRNRPFASGRVPLALGVAVSPVLLLLGATAGFGAHVLPALGLYALVSLSYTIKLKEFQLVDVFCLAFLYVIRLFAGGLATGYYLSLWLLGFSTFLFLGLAFVKRAAELKSVDAPHVRLDRRGYSTDDLPTLTIMGVCANFTSCILLVLFVQSPQVAQRYASPMVLWALAPLILFWQLRLWLSTARGYMHDDPIVYSSRDWVSWAASVVAVAVMVLANHPNLPGGVALVGLRAG